MSARIFYGLGTGIVAIALVRLLDIAWPTGINHWWVYALELTAGFVLMCVFIPQPPSKAKGGGE